MKLSRYAEKCRLGLVPFRYDETSRSFQAGASKNWPQNASFAQCRMQAFRDMPPRQLGHRFTEAGR